MAQRAPIWGMLQISYYKAMTKRHGRSIGALAWTIRRKGKWQVNVLPTPCSLSMLKDPL